MPGGRGKRGGYRQPANPAPVSGPGALSARTDGGAGQPIRVASGGDYGDRKASVELQQAAPLAAAPPAASTQMPGGAATPFRPTDMWAPTERPDEPLTAGAALGDGFTPNPNESTIALLQELYATFGNDDIRDVLEELQAEQ